MQYCHATHQRGVTLCKKEIGKPGIRSTPARRSGPASRWGFKRCFQVVYESHDNSLICRFSQRCCPSFAPSQILCSGGVDILVQCSTRFVFLQRTMYSLIQTYPLHASKVSKVQVKKKSLFIRESPSTSQGRLNGSVGGHRHL